MKRNPRYWTHGITYRRGCARGGMHKVYIPWGLTWALLLGERRKPKRKKFLRRNTTTPIS
jgi:hypothetical protein